jgi:hypothetical protein
LANKLELKTDATPTARSVLDHFGDLQFMNFFPEHAF